MVNETFSESEIPEVYVTIPDSIPQLKTLRTNHPCAFCNFHGHYTHLCPRLEDYHSSLQVVRQFEAKRNKCTPSLFAISASVELEDLPTPIDILPLIST